MTNLESRYNNVFGAKTSGGRLSGGFFLLIAGMLLVVASMVLFFIAYSKGKFLADGGYNDDYFVWMRVAIPLAAGGLTAIVLGVTVALPTKTVMRILSYVGTALCLLAVVLVTVHYPDNWAVSGSGQASYEGLDSAIFAVGMVGLLAALFTSLIGYYLGKLQPTAVGGGDEDVDDESYGPGYEVPDWVVERDIEYAMKRHGVSWGDGKTSGSSNLNVNVADAVGGNFVVGGLGKARTVQLDAEQVDMGVKGLTTIRPAKKPALPGEWADDSTAALRALRNKQQAGGAAGDAVLPKSARLSWWRRFWNALTGRNRKVGTGAPAAKLSQANLNPVQPPVAAKKGKTVVIDDKK